MTEKHRIDASDVGSLEDVLGRNDPLLASPVRASAQEPIEETHTVKCWPKFFSAILDGSKRFEIRKNDRNYLEGDTIVLQEWDPETRRYSGRSAEFRIGYCTAFEQQEGWCVFSLQESAAEARGRQQAEQDARMLCNGSCDIELARRQVGPDGDVPGNARECAHLWEREAHRLEMIRRDLSARVQQAEQARYEAVRLRQQDYDSLRNAITMLDETVTRQHTEVTALTQALKDAEHEAFIAGWRAGFQEALRPDEHPEQDRCQVAYEEWLRERGRA